MQSETRIPFLVDLSGLVMFMLGVPSVGGVVVGYGVSMVGAGIVVYSVEPAVFMWVWFDRDAWYNRAGRMMDAREKASGD
ncbi:hypothetical protein [Haloarcula marina]|uniref:hypothetical protein n=1 Tax=Haloarcula marina TaxID=2961574 RepID=UPI0020B738B2|nr:hypothetical protein [Halomicroarcula marina]